MAPTRPAETTSSSTRAVRTGRCASRGTTTWPEPRQPAADGLVVISLWRDNLCIGTFRLAVDEVPDLVHALTEGLAPADGGSLPDTA